MTVTVKKYENRRLYDTSTSKYINLEALAAMIVEGVDVIVVDAKSGADLTQEVLVQVVLEGSPATELPVALLRRIIRARGEGPLRRLAHEQLTLGFELLEAQLAQAEAWLSQLDAPLPTGDAEWAQETTGDGAAWRAPGQGQAELEALRVELSRLEARLARP